MAAGQKRVVSKQKKKNKKQKQDNNPTSVASLVPSSSLPASEHLSFFLNWFQSANGLKLSSLELESFKAHMKDAFGTSWKEELFEGKLLEGTVDPGNPAILVISTSAIRSLELLRLECRDAKLFLETYETQDQVTISKDETVVLDGAGDKKAIKERCELLRSTIESSTSEYDQEKLQERLAKLSGGVAVLKIGRASEAEVGEKKDRVTDALNATKAAVEEGIVPGGGVALLYASRELDKLQTANFDQKIGVQIIRML
ncbi:hypothetical protein IFM89_019646 [Coptis chinensis]|uniref:Uncharacterized protein n=1 Tax=Coptis chinensis TaxID=261450 RepID=A0A835I2B4_9MAGN|nr:hypothetical protein IFM89_019646 [Coptis chinensis]